MADFCEQCAKVLNLPSGDMKGLVTQAQYKNGLAALVICEGCGHIQVDPDGNCISKDCLEGGHI